MQLLWACGGRGALSAAQNLHSLPGLRKPESPLPDFTRFPLKLWQSPQLRPEQILFGSVLMINRSTASKESVVWSYFLEQLCEWCQRSNDEVSGTAKIVSLD